MKQYIEKSALVAEIEKLESRFQNGSDEDYADGYHYSLKLVKRILSTLEVKEDDLVEELDYNDYMTFFKEHPEYNNGDWGFEETWTFGQYCYKLGLKAQQGE